MRKIGFIMFAFLLALPVFAQQATSGSARAMAQREMFDVRATSTESFGAWRAAVRNEIEGRRDEFKSMMEEQREKTKKKIEEKRKTLQEKLQTIKEENKKRIVANIDKQMDALNERRTTQFTNALDQMEVVLERIAERVGRAETQGKNGAATRTAIADAKDAIASGRSAVVAQAGKTYAITITTDAKLKDDVAKAREAMKTDIATVFKKVKDARDAVHAAAVTLAQTAQGEKTATSSEANQ